MGEARATVKLSAAGSTMPGELMHGLRGHFAQEGLWYGQERPCLTFGMDRNVLVCTIVPS